MLATLDESGLREYVGVGDRADAAAVDGEDRVARLEARAVRGRVRRDGDDHDADAAPALHDADADVGLGHAAVREERGRRRRDPERPPAIFTP